ncbi:hypothetical protein C8J56DRAFT_778987 [Mycena floridula]|nr:hypothetical protein C8J56DRAFT_778987 [Mycena floridula]
MAGIGPQLPPHLLQSTTEPEEEEDEDDYAPALPPDLVVSRTAGPSVKPASPPRKVQGPALPSAYDDDSDEDIGPRPLAAGEGPRDEVDGVKQFMEKEESRRKQIEVRAIDAAKPKALKRDEWMLVPPSSSDLLAKLDPTKLSKPRQFARSAAPVRNTDNSLWTETPAERQQRLADEVSGKKRRAVNADTGPLAGSEEDLEMRKRQRIDAQIRSGVENHTRKVRGGALVEKHAKEAKPDEKEDKGIWDHSRDMSLGGRLMDDSQRTKLIRDAKGLGDRFGAGTSGGFL